MFLRLVTRVFSTIEVVGQHHIPQDQPIIFVGNHPNSLLDPVMIITNGGRRIAFAAKDTLFQYWPLRILFSALGAVPIRRKQDHQDSKLDNSHAFEALFDVLKHNGCMGIFPEGISHISAELASKTGAARIALGSNKQLVPGQAVHIIPCGLTYKSRRRMRTSVLVQFGAPIIIDSTWQQKYQNEEKVATQELTSIIDERLRALTINAPDFETLRFLITARRLYQPTDKRLSIETHNLLMRRFIDHYDRLKDIPEIRRFFRTRCLRYEMDIAGINDHQLMHLQDNKNFAENVEALSLFFAYLPMALPGILIHYPILVLAIVAGEGLLRRCYRDHQNDECFCVLIVSVFPVPLYSFGRGLWGSIFLVTFWCSYPPVVGAPFVS